MQRRADGIMREGPELKYLVELPEDRETLVLLSKRLVTLTLSTLPLCLPKNPRSTSLFIFLVPFTTWITLQYLLSLSTSVFPE